MRTSTETYDATPVAVFAADGQLVWWDPRWAALFGDPTRFGAEERDLVRLRFPVASDRGRLTSRPVIPVNAEAADQALVADLRRAAARFPDDPCVSELVAGRVAGTPRFAAFWADAAAGRHAEDRKTVRHPDIGEVRVGRAASLGASTRRPFPAHPRGGRPRAGPALARRPRLDGSCPEGPGPDVRTQSQLAQLVAVGRTLLVIPASSRA
ncbi:hypothetical protein [Streptomyces sp. WG5]|uniref:MmyB family transcriptional regulator n=1 Tax=Streptomyces sp. WG5 TaxID=3417648 RepID=UPI003CE7DA1B